ncbi:MAG: amidohydrolase family protein [Planctomycetota bacterium]|jgi:predicted amidohydrolase|nr:amidohydrolase family protein [Planctomycetota bacterium]
MKLDILIRNGRVFDPSRNLDGIEDIGIVDDRVVGIPEGSVEARQEIDASGCLVFPGLIDFHAHFFHSGGTTPIRPDLMLATGVTGTVDAGTSGCANYDAFYKADIIPSRLRIKSFINVHSAGLPDEWMPENIDPRYYNEKDIRKVKDCHGDDILGLKIRLASDLCSDIQPLKAALALAERIGDLRVCVHVTNSPCRMEEIADLLRPGDIFCHMYHGRRDTILDPTDEIWPKIRRARERGVIFDSSHGMGNFCHAVALKAIQRGFWPDVISTDIGNFKIYISHWARSLPFLMSKHLDMGMDLTSVIRAVTETPARLMGLAGRIGTLAPKAYADVAIFRLEDRRVRHQDFFNDFFYGRRLFMPRFVICGGEYVWGAADFNIE